MKNYWIYLIALCSGGLGVFAFSPFDLWGLAYISLLGLIWISQYRVKRTALFASFCWGMGFFAFGVNWLNVSIIQFGGAEGWQSYSLVLLLSAYLSLFPTLFTYLIQRFRITSLALYPALWTLTEFLRGWLFTGFPWLQFGYSQIDSPFASVATLFGVEGLTFLTLWLSAVLFSLISALIRRNTLVFISNLVMVLLVSGLAIATSQLSFIKEQPERALTITLAQGNIEQHLKWDPSYLYQTLDIYQKLISQHLESSDLIVLPESAIPALENDIQPFFTALQRAAERAGTEVMVGTVFQDVGSGKLFNSIINVGSRENPYRLQKAMRYNKHHLVPFGEYVPVESLLRPLGTVFNLPMSAFQSGEKIQPPLSAKQRLLTAAICYEIIFGDQLQQNIRPETDFILTVSNDGWFGDSIGPWQHLQMARMRALELGKPIIRSTNTGISAFINAQGKIVAQAPQFIETTLTYRLAPTEGKTPYSVLGNKPLYLLISFLFLFRLIIAAIRRMIGKGKIK